MCTCSSLVIRRTASAPNLVVEALPDPFPRPRNPSRQPRQGRPKYKREVRRLPSEGRKSQGKEEDGDVPTAPPQAGEDEERVFEEEIYGRNKAEQLNPTYSYAHKESTNSAKNQRLEIVRSAL